MTFEPTPLAGAYVIGLERLEDERGYFARSYCEAEFRAHGLDPRIAQCNLSFNARRGTLRGLHYQRAPHAEVKLVRCVQGAIYDVAVDLRPGSPSFGRWTAVELSAENGLALYIPEGFAHGFQALTDGALVAYQMSVPYQPGSGAGLRFDTPWLGVEWPIAEPILSARDAQWPLELPPC